LRQCNVDCIVNIGGNRLGNTITEMLIAGSNITLILGTAVAVLILCAVDCDVMLIVMEILVAIGLVLPSLRY